MMNEKFKVDFIGIGAERCGTTWIASCLAEHPEICFSKEKEIYFFNKLDRHFLKIDNLRYERGIEWYKSFFNHCSGKSITGEFTPTYMFCPSSAARIKYHFPDVKLIVTLRNPVDRAFSQYLHNIRGGVIRKMSFEKALKKYNSYIEKGFYYRHLKYFFDIFPKKNIKVVLMSDIADNPEKVIRDIYKFLGVKHLDFRPASLFQKVNVAQEAKLQWLNFILTNIELYLRKFKMDKILHILEDLGIRKMAFDVAHFVNVKPVESYPKMKKSTHMKLRNIFLPDIVKLEKLIHKDLSLWKN